MQVINIWEPHWMSSSVYIATYRVKPGENRIHFTGVPGKPKLIHPDLIMDGARIKTYPLASNGKVAVYKVPLADFGQADLDLQEKLL